MSCHGGRSPLILPLGRGGSSPRAARCSSIYSQPLPVSWSCHAFADGLTLLLPLAPKRISSRLLKALLGAPHSSVASSTMLGHPGLGLKVLMAPPPLHRRC